ncbi:MAG: NAD(P)/FAD-dependent oxidoreductase [Puia sp.]|nr:NAD(P)/FAD-dependent oxidoreductase [Puia sp.]
MGKKAIIIGAGPAGLTAAYELIKRTDILPIILEKSEDIGGISKTVNYKGNRMDIGGHRFFSKSDRVMQWWLNIMPIQPLQETEFTVTYQRHSKTIKTENVGANSEDYPDKVMLVRKRLSRIYFLRKFFTYPIQLSIDTLRKLGLGRTIGILISYLRARLLPRKPETNLEDFFINRFGDKLYRLFFKDYTEKVWGKPCSMISAEWGAQRIKGISIAKALAHAVKSLKSTPGGKGQDIGQKGIETSLIEKFLYPKFGPGQLWEEVARQVEEAGGTILKHQDVTAVIANQDECSISGIEVLDNATGNKTLFKGDYYFSTMPVQELIAGMGEDVPGNVREVAAGLQYRDFITVGVLLKEMTPPKDNLTWGNSKILPDTWIYIQEKDVKVGRLQIFNNWSPFMVKNPDEIWIGMEYFCNTTDDFWKMSDSEIQAFAITELEQMGLASVADVIDSTLLRVEKTYPAYFGTYSRFEEIKEYTDRFANLFLVGRNGMHKYNNSDHSMLTAMVSVDNISAGVTTKANIWAINTEQEYHEESATTAAPAKGSLAKNIGELAPALTGAMAAPPLFKNYLFKNRTNKWYLGFAGLAIVIQFVIFKHFYPQAGFINGDSYVYLETAYRNFDINTYPTGYSKFLRIFSTFTKSDTALVAMQYLMLQCSALFFLFTFFFFYKPGKLVQGILLAFVVFNPLFLYLSNYVLSDSLFIPLSITWFTLLIWMLYRPTAQIIILQVVVLFIAFTVRYNALFYPIIGSLAILLTCQKVWIKMASIGGSLALIVLFIVFTTNKYHELTGKQEFTPFSGWQIANNAMYAYKYVDSFHIQPVPTKYKELDKMVRTYFDTTRDIKKYPQEMLVASTFYMWDPQSPLQKYMNLQFKKDSTAGPLKRWASVAPLYADYGQWLIRTYPYAFAEHYLWPNAVKYYAPPVEFLNTYNMGIDSVTQIAQIWFHYKNAKVKTLLKSFDVSTLDFYPILIGVMNVVFLIGSVFYLLLNGLHPKNTFAKIMWLVGGLWIVNFVFSVYASPIALRFQVFPVLVFFSTSLLLIEQIWKVAFVKPSNIPSNA